MAAPSRATMSGVGRQGPVADDRVLLVGVDVQHRRVVQGDADGAQFGRQRSREPGRQRLVAAPAQDHHRRPDGERLLEAGHAPALLIDADPQRQRRRELLDVVRELGHLLGGLDVAAEQDHAAERELARQRPHLGGDRRAGQAADEQLTDLATP